MSSGAAWDVKERIKQTIDIVDLVGDYIQLRREGRHFKGLCPWHDDSRPSLQVNRDRQSFKCWVCDIGGDIFSFMMEMERVAFPEALQMLAERAGVPLTQLPVGAPSDQQKSQRLEALAWAERQYHECLLREPEAQPARDYLTGRGITDESVRRFHLGFAPNRSRWLLDRARGTAFTPQLLEKVGFLSPSQEGSGWYDRFRGRVLFSIRDPQGRPVGMGGRVLPESGNTSPAKYVNSPDTPEFHKHNLLYGLDQAREGIRKSKTAVVMEGYTDCIMAHQMGCTQAVAVLGTALGEKHVKLLEQYGAERVVLVLDGDEAGQKRTNEVLELFLRSHLDLRVLTLPDELDPCDFLLERGAAEFQRLLGEAVDALEHKFRQVESRLDPGASVHQVQAAVEEVLKLVAQAPRLSQAAGASATQGLEHQVLHRLARRSVAAGGNVALAEEQLRTRLAALRRASSARSERFARPTIGEAVDEPKERVRLEAWETALLELVLDGPGCLAEVRHHLGVETLATPAAREIYQRCCDLADEGEAPSLARLLLEFDDPRMKNLLVSLDEGASSKAHLDRSVRLGGWLELFHQRQQQRMIQSQTAVLRERRLDPEEEWEVLERIVQQRQRPRSSAPTEG